MSDREGAAAPSDEEFIAEVLPRVLVHRQRTRVERILHQLVVLEYSAGAFSAGVDRETAEQLITRAIRRAVETESEAARRTSPDVNGEALDPRELRPDRSSVFVRAAGRGPSDSSVVSPVPMDNVPMSESVGREELNAKMDALRQEMRAESAEMRAQFASLGARIDASVSNMAVSVAQLGGKIDAGLGEVKGSVDGLKSSITTMQWFIASAVAVGGIWLAYLQLRQADAPTQAQSQPAPQINIYGSAPTASAAIVAPVRAPSSR